MIEQDNPYAFLAKPPQLPRGAITGFVTVTLRKAIVSLELPPGVTVDKPALCTRLSVSRSPVSEALARLQAEGLIEIRPQRGSTVSRIFLADLEQYLFIRLALETEAARTLAARVTPHLLVRLEDNLDRQRAAVEREACSDFDALDHTFHEILFQALDRARVKAMVDTARAHFDRARRLIRSPRPLGVTLGEHEAIAAALRSGDPETAAHAMHAHIEARAAAVFALARQNPGLFADGGRVLSAQRRSA